MRGKIPGPLLLVVCMLAVLGLTACGQKEVNKAEMKSFNLYYPNRSDTRLDFEKYETEEKEIGQYAEDLLQRLKEQPQDVDLKAAIPQDVELKGYRIEEKQISLKFNESYQRMDPYQEILTRAAVVRTLTQIPGVDYVTFLIGENPLKDVSGALVGTMTAEMFVDNAGTEISTYEKTKLKLYFANQQGDKLAAVARSVVYNSNVSVEKLVVEQLILGPSKQDDVISYPTINPETKIINVTTRDGICYVNLDETFRTNTTQAGSETTIYSIANSLIELPNVNKVQILINGESNIQYREKISLTTIFERKLEIVE